MWENHMYGLTRVIGLPYGFPVSTLPGKLGGLFRLNRADSGLVGLFGRDRSDPAAHAKH